MSLSSNSDSDADAIKELFRRVLYNVHTSMPGVITAVGDYKGVRVVSVRPVIQQIDTLEDEQTLKAIDPIPNTPVCVPHVEDLGLSITVPLRVGNEGMIHFAERSLDNWIEKGGVQPPAEPIQPRSHDFSDAIFVPGITSVANPIKTWSDTTVEIRNIDATVAVSVSVDEVALRAGGAVVSLPGDGKVHITGDIVHTGKLISSDKVIGIAGVETGTGLSLDNHVHGGVETGGGTSGAPVS